MGDKPQDIKISDHALMRYIERFYGINLDAVREEIIGHTRDAINSGANGVQVNGFLFQISPQTRTVVTILTPEQRKNRSLSYCARYYGGKP